MRFRPPRTWVLIALGIGLLGLLFAVLVTPRLLYPPISDGALDRNRITGKDRIQLRNERLRLQNDARATLLQGVSALIAVGGLLVTLRINNQRGQATERFVSAINQLGNEQLEVRLGGIYALDQIVQLTAPSAVYQDDGNPLWRDLVYV